MFDEQRYAYIARFFTVPVDRPVYGGPKKSDCF